MKVKVKLTFTLHARTMLSPNAAPKLSGGRAFGIGGGGGGGAAEGAMLARQPMTDISMTMKAIQAHMASVEASTSITITV